MIIKLEFATFLFLLHLTKLHFHANEPTMFESNKPKKIIAFLLIAKCRDQKFPLLHQRPVIPEAKYSLVLVYPAQSLFHRCKTFPRPGHVSFFFLRFSPAHRFALSLFFSYNRLFAAVVIKFSRWVALNRTQWEPWRGGGRKESRGSNQMQGEGGGEKGWGESWEYDTNEFERGVHAGTKPRRVTLGLLEVLKSVSEKRVTMGTSQREKEREREGWPTIGRVICVKLKDRRSVGLKSSGR